MQTWFEKLTRWFVIVLSLPTALVILTWNSVPGNIDFPIKLAMERLLLFAVSPSYAASANLGVAFTERRMAETEELLGQKQSGQGLVYLANQVTETKSTILTGQKREEQAKVASRYVATLEQTKTKLEEQKQNIIATTKEPEIVRAQASPQPTRPPTTQKSAPPTPKPTPPTAGQPPPQEVIHEIEQTQELIEETIEDLEEVARPANQGQDGQDRGGSEEHRQDEGRGNENRGRSDEQNDD